MRKPNVIVFFTDQQRFDTTGLHGNPMGLTPNFDRYGRQGTHLFNAISCQPLCGPARSCMQTGRYATQTGCWRNHIPLPPDAETLARRFGRGDLDPAPCEGFAQQHFDLGVDRAEIGGCGPLQRRVERRIEPQRECFLGRAGHGW